MLKMIRPYQSAEIIDQIDNQKKLPLGYISRVIDSIELKTPQLICHRYIMDEVRDELENQNDFIDISYVIYDKLFEILEE